MKSGGRDEYLVSFLIEAVSAALPAEWDVECRDESARVLTTVTSHVLLLFFLAHQHKAAGRKTRLDIQNYGCNGKLLSDHGVVERNRISSLHQMRPIVTAAAWFVYLRVCQLLASVGPAKTAETIDI